MSYQAYSFGSGIVTQPFLLSAKNLPLKVGGATGDIGTFSVPLGLTRYRLNWGTSLAVGGMVAFLESATGIMDHGRIGLFQSPNGGGTNYVAPFQPTTVPGVETAGLGGGLASGQALYICQTQASTSTFVPTGSFYVCVWPLM